MNDQFTNCFFTIKIKALTSVRTFERLTQILLEEGIIFATSASSYNHSMSLVDILIENVIPLPSLISEIYKNVYQFLYVQDL